MQSLFLTGVLTALMYAGFSAAFASALCFLWVDVIKPQNLAYSIITGMPLSMIAAAAMLVLFFTRDRKSPPKFGVILLLILVFAIWITFTTMTSLVPSQAWGKWDWASRVIIFAIVIPYLFRSRVQIEAFILVFIFASSTIIFSAGVKTLLGGGGYQTLAIIGNGNAGLSETSTLAVVCIMLIPLVMFLMRHTLFFPKNIVTMGLFVMIIVLCLATVVGTGARTGLIAVGAMCLLSIVQSKRKFWWLSGLAAVAIVVANIDLSNTPWGQRMSTIQTYSSDSSAMGRVMVWYWTLDFVRSHPFGGGFNAFVLNRIHGVSSDGVILYYDEGVVAGKAFHSIYFEMLGEQGYVGFGIYFAMIVIALLKLHKLKKAWRNHPGMGWLGDLANAMITSIVVFLAGGAFVGIAYQPYIFYMLSLTVAIDQYAARAVKIQTEERGRVKP